MLKYKTQKIEVQQRAKKELEKIDKNILKERDKLGFLHGIITKTANDLVSDVKSSLEFLGFKQVINVDEVIQNNVTKVQKQEDLQIKDKSPLLLIEVKGISGLPRESDTIQVIKYVPRRMKELESTEVRGVSIINHHRNIPGLERDNKNVFTEQQIEDSRNHDITLLTTWDLFLLINGMLEWGWNPESIQELFYKSLRMPRFPTIYKPIGKIIKYWEEPEAVGVEIFEEKIINKNQRIGYVIENGFLEEEILSLQVESQYVKEAVSGQLAGIKTKYSKDDLKKGTIVYTVKKENNY